MEAKLRRIRPPVNDTKPIIIKCPRCDHQWGYKGKNPYIVSCPYCKDTLTIRKHRIDPLVDGGQTRQFNKESPQTEKVEVKASSFQSAIEDWNRSGERFSP